jgi:outer membrane protein assembly factor BamB
MIFVVGDVGDQECLAAFDTDGQSKGQKAFGAANTKDPTHFNGGRSTPTVEGGAVFVGGALGEMACLDAKSLEKRWAVNVKEEFHGARPQWEYAESPLGDGDNVICTPGGPDASIVALNKNTGQTVWTSKGLSDPAAYASCLKMTVDKLPMIVAMTGKGLVGVSAKTGQFLWRWDRPWNKTANIPSPIFLGHRVFEATGYKTGGGAIDLTVSENGVKVAPAWETTDLVCKQGGYVLVDGFIYGNNDVAGWSCLDFQTGATKWKAPGLGMGSIISADGMLYIQGENAKTREIALVKASSEAYTPVSKFSLPEGGQGSVWAHPAIAAGRLYIRHGDLLYCYDLKAGETKKAAEPPAK